MRSMSIFGWIVLITVVILITKHPAEAGHAVSGFFNNLGTFVASL